MNKLAEGVAGATLGATACIVWPYIPGSGAFRVKAVEEKSPLAFIEHYHLGIGLIAIQPKNPFLVGSGAIFIASEIFSDHPFGAGKSDWEIKGNMVLSSILTPLLLIRVGSA